MFCLESDIHVMLTRGNSISTSVLLYSFCTHGVIFKLSVLVIIIIAKIHVWLHVGLCWGSYHDYDKYRKTFIVYARNNQLWENGQFGT